MRIVRVADDIRERSNVSHSLIVGQDVTHRGGKRTGISTMPMAIGSVEMQTNYSGKAFASWDTLLRPVSMDGDGEFAPFIQYPGGAGLIVQDDLIPFTNPTGYERSHVSTNRSDTGSTGHYFEVLGRVSGESGLLTHVNSGVPLYQNDYRFMALRGPLVMQGWGYDTYGHPIPNKSDNISSASTGLFETVNLDSTKFLDDHLKQPRAWPVAPVDLRLDRQRGVWISPFYGFKELTADSDIEHSASGFASDTYGTYTVYNARDRIWGGSKLSATWYSHSGVSGVWYSHQAWSATKTRGTAQFGILPNTVGTVINSIGLNGHLPSSTINSYLPTNHVVVQSGAVCWSELVYYEGSGSRWEVYSADCSGTT